MFQSEVSWISTNGLVIVNNELRIKIDLNNLKMLFTKIPAINFFAESDGGNFLKTGFQLHIIRWSNKEHPECLCYHFNNHAKISGATMVASLSTINLGVSIASFPQVIFSLGTAPE
jgi:hypothetical protein